MPTNASRSGVRRRARPAPARSSRSRSCGRSPARPCSSGSSPRSIAEQRRLAAAVAAGDRKPLPGHEVEIDRAEREVAAPGDGAGEAGDDAARPVPALSPSWSCHGSNGFSGSSLRSSSRSAWRTLVISACVPRRSAMPPRPAPALRALVEQRRELLAVAPAPPSKRPYCPAPSRVARSRVLRPPSRALPHAAAAGLDLGDPRHRAVEEGAVVRDDDERDSVVATNRSSRSSPSKSRSFVGSSSRSTS